MYVAVLGCAMVVTVLGVSAILVTRVEGKVMMGAADLAAARNLAQSSIDLGLFTMYNNTSWRTAIAPGAWRTNQAAGDGLISLSVTDPVDSVFSDTRWEPVTFTGTGKVREAQYLLEATAVAQPLPLPALNTCLHTAGNVTVSLLKNITITGAPLSMNGSVNGPGTINGNVQAGSQGTAATINGTSTIPSSAKEMPDTGLFLMYKNLATTITGVTTIDRQALTASSNPWGTANADGVYYIDAGSNDFTIKRSRIQGTLLIKVATGKKVLLDTTVFMQSHRADYPTLIVDGALEISLTSASTNLSEASEGVNLNSMQAPFLGTYDSDMTDSYPNEVQGLVHATGAVSLKLTSIIRGAIIALGNVSVTGTPQLIHDSDLYSHPPMGYVTYAIQLGSGSWRRVVDP